MSAALVEMVAQMLLDLLVQMQPVHQVHLEQHPPVMAAAEVALPLRSVEMERVLPIESLLLQVAVAVAADAVDLMPQRRPMMLVETHQETLEAPDSVPVTAHPIAAWAEQFLQMAMVALVE
jgi:hypothetical protein